MLRWSQLFVIYLATARGFPLDMKFLTFLLQCCGNTSTTLQYEGQSSLFIGLLFYRNFMSGGKPRAVGRLTTNDSSVTFDVKTMYSTHLQPLILPQHCSMKVRAVGSLSYYFTITSTKCCKNTVVSPDDGHIGT